MLEVRRFGDGLLERLRGTTANHVMYSVDVAPSLPCSQKAWDGVGEAMLEGRYYDATCGALHALHVTEDKRCGNRIGLARSTARHDDRDIGTDELCEALRGIEVDGFLG